MFLGYGVELVEILSTKCPKSGQSRVLATVNVSDEPMFQETELAEYKAYLSEPWPMPVPRNGRKRSGSGRPTTPEYVKDDVRAECHQCCAICGSMDNGEVAHIDPVRGTLNNSPDNLVFLCTLCRARHKVHYAASVIMPRRAPDCVVDASRRQYDEAYAA